MKKKAVRRKSLTDWKRLDQMRDEDIDFSDIPPATAEAFARAVIQWGPAGRVPKVLITLHLDADVLQWFRALGKGYQSRINLLLRSYMDAHEEKPARRRR